ncbi:UDP-glycosyltransferase 83A1-like, partial [Olea europaea subsp. europaea]
MVSIPDGLESPDDRSDLGKEIESVSAVMPGELMALIAQITSPESDRITYLIVDATMGGALEVAEKMGIKKVAFWPTATTLFALLFKVPNLIDDGIIDSNVPQIEIRFLTSSHLRTTSDPMKKGMLLKSSPSRAAMKEEMERGRDLVEVPGAVCQLNNPLIKLAKSISGPYRSLNLEGGWWVRPVFKKKVKNFERTPPMCLTWQRHKPL